jgi:hypothetical protein
MVTKVQKGVEITIIVTPLCTYVEETFFFQFLISSITQKNKIKKNKYVINIFYYPRSKCFFVKSYQNEVIYTVICGRK